MSYRLNCCWRASYITTVTYLMNKFHIKNLQGPFSKILWENIFCRYLKTQPPTHFFLPGLCLYFGIRIISPLVVASALVDLWELTRTTFMTSRNIQSSRWATAKLTAPLYHDILYRQPTTTNSKQEKWFVCLLFKQPWKLVSPEKK